MTTEFKKGEKALTLIYNMLRYGNTSRRRKSMQNELNRVAVTMHFWANVNYNWFSVPFRTFHPAT